MYNAIGMVELSSIARGIYTADQMIKTAAVEAVSCTAVCPGKYIVLIQGDVAAIESSVDAGIQSAGEYIVDHFIIPNVHPGIFPAISSTTLPEQRAALGIIESFSLASMIHSADAALKAADIQGVELRLGSGLGGKAYFTFTGDVAAVEAAADAGKALVRDSGLLVDIEVIPSPAERLWDSLL